MHFRSFAPGLMAVAVAVVHSAVAVAQPVIYFKEIPIPLTVDSSRVVIRLAPIPDSSITPDILEDFGRLIELDTGAQPLTGFFAFMISSGGSYASFVDSLRESPLIAQAEPFYRYQGEPCLFGNDIFVGFNPGTNQHTIDSLKNAYNLTTQPLLRCAPHVNRLRLADGSSSGVVEIAQALAERPETYLAHPDIAIDVQTDAYQTYDFYEQYCTHVKRTAGVTPASSVWDFAGLTRPVVVAIIDEGVAPHEDLPASRIVPGWDVFDNDSIATPGQKSSHGMACAGIVAASHTTDSVSGLSSTSGVLSLAPNVLIMSIKIFADTGAPTTTLSRLTDAYNSAWKLGADVISSSISIKGTNLPLQVLSDAIDSAYYRGRNDRGCVIVGSSGNRALTCPNFVNFPSAFTHVLAVGAINDLDELWYYSQYGDSLDLVAPSGLSELQAVWTIDQMGTAGINPNLQDPMDCARFPLKSNNTNYYCEFSGTSAAAPQVAGIAALLLSRDSMLTSAQVYEIIKLSADTGLVNGLQFIPPTPAFGYGRADAYRALTAISHGDVDNSGQLVPDLVDLTVLVDHLYITNAPLFPTVRLGDCDCDGYTDLVDLSYLVDNLFLGGPPPINPCFKF